MFGILSTSRNHVKRDACNVSPLWNKAAFATALILLGGAGQSLAGPGVAAIPPPAQVARAHTLCTEIVGVDPDDGRFSGCVASLAASLQTARQEHAIIQARGKCFAQGLRPGSSELSLCLLGASAVNLESGAVDLTEGISSANMPDQADTTGALSTESRTGREQQACARTGFDPAFGAFANCVADLQSVLQNTEIPAN